MQSQQKIESHSNYEACKPFQESSSVEQTALLIKSSTQRLTKAQFTHWEIFSYAAGLTIFFFVIFIGGRLGLFENNKLILFGFALLTSAATTGLCAFFNPKFFYRRWATIIISFGLLSQTEISFEFSIKNAQVMSFVAKNS